MDEKITVPLVCSECGADGIGSCACNAPYLPPALKKATEAIVANPEKSDRAIAEEIGTSHVTVHRARKSTVTRNVTVEQEKRIGRDGKARKMPDPEILRQKEQAKLLREQKKEQREAEKRQQAEEQAAWAEKVEKTFPGNDPFTSSMRERLKGKRVPPHINIFVESFTNRLEKSEGQLDEIMRNWEHMGAYRRHRLIAVLRKIGNFYITAAQTLKAKEHVPDFDNMKVITYDPEEVN